MVIRSALVAITAVLCLAAPAAAQQRAAIPSVQLPAELDRVLRDYEKAWRARDARALAALFHPEGFVLSSGVSPVGGRDAIQKHYDGAGGPLYLRAISYATDDTIGYIIGMFAGASRKDVGKFVLALRRANPKVPWLIAADMDNQIER